VDSGDQWLVQLRKGIVQLLILRLLVLQGELHGYAIVKELLSLGPIVAGESTVYPVLRRLEAEKLLTSRWVESNGGPPRKYYTVSPAGIAFLDGAQKEWDALVAVIDRLRGEERLGQKA
jgi:PadR family transcriptional regulator PadR